MRKHNPISGIISFICVAVLVLGCFGMVMHLTKNSDTPNPTETATIDKSAYDIAVENGFEGTVQEWLASLRGVDGQSDTTINEAYVGKKLVSYGDSLTARPYPTDDNAGWQSVVKNTLGFASHTNLGIGSTTMSNVIANSMISADRIQAIKTANPDVLTIWGGVNDVSADADFGTSAEFDKPLAEKDLSTIAGAYSYLIETLLSWKPSLQILIIVQYNCGYGSYADTYEKINELRTITFDVAHRYNLNYVDGNDIGINEFTVSALTHDGIHIENTETLYRVAGLVINALNKMAFKV